VKRKRARDNLRRLNFGMAACLSCAQCALSIPMDVVSAARKKDKGAPSL